MDHLQLDDRCQCGHIMKNHIFDIKKTMKSDRVEGKCKFCDCKDIALE